MVASLPGWPEAPGRRPPATHRRVSPRGRWTPPPRLCGLPDTGRRPPAAWADAGRGVGESPPGPAQGVPRPSCGWHAEPSRRRVAARAPPGLEGCAWALLPDCSARLRSLPDDYQTLLCPLSLGDLCNSTHALGATEVRYDSTKT